MMPACDTGVPGFPPATEAMDNGQIYGWACECSESQGGPVRPPILAPHVGAAYRLRTRMSQTKFRAGHAIVARRSENAALCGDHGGLRITNHYPVLSVRGTVTVKR